MNNFKFCLNTATENTPAFKKFGGEVIQSTFVIVSDDDTSVVYGNAINDTTKIGAPGIRVNFSVNQGGAPVWLSGILVAATDTGNERAPQLRGVVKDSKTGTEVSVSAWRKSGARGDFIAAVAQIKTPSEAVAVNANVDAQSADVGY